MTYLFTELIKSENICIANNTSLAAFRRLKVFLESPVVNFAKFGRWCKYVEMAVFLKVTRFFQHFDQPRTRGWWLSADSLKRTWEVEHNITHVHIPCTILEHQLTVTCLVLSWLNHIYVKPNIYCNLSSFMSQCNSYVGCYIMLKS